MKNEEGRIRKYNLLWKYPTDYWVRSVSITADGHHIVVGSGEDNNVYLLKSEGDRGELLWGYGTGDAVVESVAITPDGNYIAAGSGGMGRSKLSLLSEGLLSVETWFWACFWACFC